jgi:DNA polymerase I
MIMQVHDELVFEIYKNELEILKKEIKSIMENIILFEAKLFVDI